MLIALRWRNLPFNGTFTHTSFNGFEVFDLTENPEISGFSIDPITNLVGLTTADIIFDSSTIWVNWTGLTFQTGTIVKIDLTFDPPLNPSEVSIAQTLDGSLSPITNASTLTVVDGTELVLLGDIETQGLLRSTEQRLRQRSASMEPLRYPEAVTLNYQIVRRTILSATEC